MDLQAKMLENRGEREREREIYRYPPTPAASRESASEDALLATRGEKRKFAGSVLRALLFGCGRGAVCEPWRLEDSSES